jgi:hypothetical protein
MSLNFWKLQIHYLEWILSIHKCNWVINLLKKNPIKISQSLVGIKSWFKNMFYKKIAWIHWKNIHKYIGQFSILKKINMNLLESSKLNVHIHMWMEFSLSRSMSNGFNILLICFEKKVSKLFINKPINQKTDLELELFWIHTKYTQKMNNQSRFHPNLCYFTNFSSIKHKNAPCDQVIF